MAHTSWQIGDLTALSLRLSPDKFINPLMLMKRTDTASLTAFQAPVIWGVQKMCNNLHVQP